MKMASHWTYATWFTILRVYAGLFWLVHGIPKFLQADKFMPPNGYMPQVISQAASSQGGLYHDFLVNVVTPNIALFAELTRLGEVLTGCMLFFGIFTRVGGLVGCFLALNYMAAQVQFSHLDTIGSLNGVAFVLSFLMFAVPAGRVAGVDALLGRSKAIPAAAGARVVPEFVDEPPPGPPHTPPPAG